MTQSLELLEELHSLTSGYNLWRAGSSITLSVSVTVRPDQGLTHDGYESKSFKGSTVGKGSKDCLSPVLARAIKWCRENKGKRISKGDS